MTARGLGVGLVGLGFGLVTLGIWLKHARGWDTPGVFGVHLLATVVGFLPGLMLIVRKPADRGSP